MTFLPPVALFTPALSGSSNPDGSLQDSSIPVISESLSAARISSLVRARPVQKLIRGVNKPLLILGVDAVLFVHMMNCITGRAGLIFKNILLTAGVIAGAVMIALIILRKRGIRK